MGGSSTIANSETKIEALKLQSSVYGAAIPVLGGVNRIPGNLIWYGDFTATPHTSTQDQGGKGGGVKTQNTTYTYAASVLMGICQGPVGAIARVWKGKEVFEGGWSPAALASASETYTPPGSGAMVYTLAHAATLVGMPVITYPLPIFRMDSGDSEPVPLGTQPQQLANGRDYSLAAGVVTILGEGLRGQLLTIQYQWGTGAPDLAPLVTLGITLANGDMAQAAPAWLTSAHPTEALAYPGLAYVHAQGYSLGSGAQVDNHSFEVQGTGAYQYGAALPDCNPAEFTADVMTNGRYGARMPAGTLDVEAWRTYCRATGLLMSPLLTEQVRAGDYIDQICRLTNAAPVWSFDRLLIVPYGDTAATGNGATYTPDTTPRYDLDDDHWLQDGTADPLQWLLKAPSNRYNHLRVEFNDRSNYYSKGIAEATDDADIAVNGRRTMDTIVAPWVCDMAVARLVAQIALQRSLNISGTGTVRLPWAYCLLECMDLVTLTDVALGFSQQPVRITAIGEDEDGMLELEVEDWPLGSASATRYPSQVAAGFQHNYNVAPGDVDAPFIFEAPADIAGATGLEIYAAVRGSGAHWGGCQVWVSLDDASYRLAGVVYGPARYGTLSAAAAAGAATLAVQGLGTAQLLSGSATDAAQLATLCYVGGAAPEYLAYETATLTGAGAYTLGGLVHAAYRTAADAHASGAPFARVDERMAKSGPLDPALIGSTVWFKFCSFNTYGGAQQGLADVSATAYVVTGAQYKRPPADVSAAALALLAGGPQITWQPNRDIGYAATEVRLGASWATGTRLFLGAADGFVWRWPGPGVYTLLLKHIDKRGNESATPAPLVLTVGADGVATFSAPQWRTAADGPAVWVTDLGAPAIWPLAAGQTMVNTDQLAASAATDVYQGTGGFVSASQVLADYGVSLFYSGVYAPQAFLLRKPAQVVVTCSFDVLIPTSSSALAYGQFFIVLNDSAEVFAGREFQKSLSPSDAEPGMVPVVLTTVFNLPAGRHLIGAYINNKAGVRTPPWIDVTFAGNVTTKLEVIKK
jgi:hypothetical protein